MNSNNHELGCGRQSLTITVGGNDEQTSEHCGSDGFLCDGCRAERAETLVQQLRDELRAVRGDMVPVRMVAALESGAIETEREANWVHFHPETFCHLCGRRNPTSWHAPTELWNAVTGKDGAIDGAGIVCPLCFIERYEAIVGKYVLWTVGVDD